MSEKGAEEGYYRFIVDFLQAIMGEEYKKVATLENEIEARLLDSILNERDMPHLITSYYDTAYDGLYQVQKGWGYISAPDAYLEEIREILSLVRKQSHDRDIT